MTISSVSLVSFKGYNRKNSKKNIHHKNYDNNKYTQSHLLKTIPATLLLAVTPINNVNAQNVIKEGMTHNFKTEVYDGKYVNEYEYVESLDFMDNAKSSMVVIFTSVDDDDIPEIAKIKYNKQSISSVDYAGERKDAISDTKTEIKVSGLILERNKNAKSKKHNEYSYYAIGDFLSERIYLDKVNPNIRLGKSQIIHEKDIKVPISKEIYNVIADTMGDKVKYFKNDDIED